MLGGHLSVGNAPGGGARLEARVPLEAPAAHARHDDFQDADEPMFDESTRGGLE
ncbi:hypothetical protein D9M69_683780 [compost metagenome]